MLRLRKGETAVFHPEGDEQALAQEIAEAFSRGSFHHAPEDVGGQAVLPDGARLVRQRGARQAGHLIGWRERSGIEFGAVGLEQPGLDVGVLHRLVRGDLAVGEPRGMPQQVLDSHVALGGSRGVGGPGEFRIGVGDAHLESGEFRQVLRHRVGQLQATVLEQQHRRNRDQRLGHRVDPEHGIARHRGPVCRVAHTDRFGIDQSAAPGHQHHGSRDLALVDLGFQGGTDARQTGARHADVLRLGRGERVGCDIGDECGEAQEECGEAGERRHGVPPGSFPHGLGCVGAFYPRPQGENPRSSAKIKVSRREDVRRRPRPTGHRSNTVAAAPQTPQPRPTR